MKQYGTKFITLANTQAGDSISTELNKAMRQLLNEKEKEGSKINILNVMYLGKEAAIQPGYMVVYEQE